MILESIAYRKAASISLESCFWWLIGFLVIIAYIK